MVKVRFMILIRVMSDYFPKKDNCNRQIILVNLICGFFFDFGFCKGGFELCTRVLLHTQSKSKVYNLFMLEGISSNGVIHILRNHQGGGGFRNDYADVIFALSNAEFDYGRGRGSRNRQKVIT